MSITIHCDLCHQVVCGRDEDGLARIYIGHQAANIYEKEKVEQYQVHEKCHTDFLRKLADDRSPCAPARTEDVHAPASAESA